MKHAACGYGFARDLAARVDAVPIACTAAQRPEVRYRISLSLRIGRRSQPDQRNKQASDTPSVNNKKMHVPY